MLNNGRIICLFKTKFYFPCSSLFNVHPLLCKRQAVVAVEDTDRGVTNTHANVCARSDSFLERKMSWFGSMKRVGGLWISYLLLVALLHVHL